MNHVTEEDLVLYNYGEHDGAAELEAHIEACADCRREFNGLRRILAAVDAARVPEPPEGFERRVWARLQPKLQPSPARWRDAFSFRHLALATGLAAMVVAVVVSVGFWPGPRAKVETPAEHGGADAAAATDAETAARVLLLALGEHLDRAEMVLSELANAGGEGPVDISQEQAWADDLIRENRLYRQTAASAGDGAVTSTLDDLERVLLEVARGPSMLSAEEAEDFRDRLESEGTVFKVRVLGSRVREREERGELATATPTV
ncbi:MAG: anti-sigma factor [Vicinamibacterales bacterium]